MGTDREKQGLVGPVRSVRAEMTRFEERGGRLTAQPWLGHIFTFNREGWLVGRVDRNPDGSEWRTANDYSDSGRLLATRVYDPSGALSREVRYVYDGEGRLIAEQHVTRDSSVTAPTIYAYDVEGRKMKVQENDSPGEANVMVGIEGTNTAVIAGEARRVETGYDRRGEAVEVKVFNADGALVSRVEITRDAQGHPLEEVQYVGDAPLFGPCAPDSGSTQEAVALTEGQQAESAAEIARLLPPGTPMSRHTHRYDCEGRLMESKLTMMGMEASRQTFTYDEAGNKSEEVSWGEDGKLAGKAIFTREYDGHGNWTKELVSTASSWDEEFGLSTPVHVTRRVITYW